MKKKLLEIKDLEIGYQVKEQKKVIQNHLNLSLNAGELICLIGPNGVGKSTFLKTLGRIQPELSGEIIIGNSPISKINQQEFSRKLALVLTEQLDIPQMSARDVISLGRYPYTGFWGNLQKKDLNIVIETAQNVGIEHLLNRSYVELSDGEKQKVMIAKALAQQTPLMLLDEPTAFLDFPTKSSLLIMLRKLARQNQMGIILSTHDIELALKTADQIWLFPEHLKMISGIPEDLVIDSQILKVFKSKEMAFNIDSGHFERQFHAQYNIEVKGDNIKANWLRKALIRNEISPSAPSDKHIVCDENYHLFAQDKEIQSFQNISELLHFLKIH